MLQFAHLSFRQHEGIFVNQPVYKTNKLAKFDFDARCLAQTEISYSISVFMPFSWKELLKLTHFTIQSSYRSQGWRLGIWAQLDTVLDGEYGKVSSMDVWLTQGGGVGAF